MLVFVQLNSWVKMSRERLFYVVDVPNKKTLCVLLHQDHHDRLHGQTDEQGSVSQPVSGRHRQDSQLQLGPIQGHFLSACQVDVVFPPACHLPKLRNNVAFLLLNRLAERLWSAGSFLGPQHPRPRVHQEGHPLHAAGWRGEGAGQWVPHQRRHQHLAYWWLWRVLYWGDDRPPHEDG